MGKTTCIWVLICLSAFLAGYWVNEWENARQAKAKFAASMTWAFEQGLLTVNQDRLRELEGEKEIRNE